MPPAQRNTKLIDSMSVDFVRTYAPTTSWGNALSGMLYLPQLRGFWPFSSVDENTDAYDLSGQGRVMSNTGGATYGEAGLVQYADFVRAGNDYFARPSEAGLLPTGGFTLGCWIRYDAPSTGNATGTMGKYGGAGTRAYLIYKTAGNALSFLVSTDGTAAVSVASTVTYAVSTWYCIICRFTPSTAIDIFVNDVQTPNAVGTPANCFAGNAAFEFGRYAAGQYFDGRMALPFLCASALSDTMIKNIWHQTRAMFGA